MNDNVLALDRFAAVLSAPAQCMSAIAVAALKKWRLLHIVEMLTSGEISK